MEPRTLLTTATGPIISEFLASNGLGLRDADGDRNDWIELHNPTGAAIDLGGWSLTDSANNLGKWRLPAVVVRPGEFLVVFASDKNRATPGAELHTNFKLGAEGEFLGLIRPDSSVADAYAPAYPPQRTDVSYGVAFGTEGARPAERRAFASPTPGAPNSDTAFGTVGAVEASTPAGFYAAPFALTLGTATEGATIRYTLDGSTPTEGHGQVYTGTILVDRTTILRAAAFKPGHQARPPIARTFLFLDDVIRQSPDGSTPPGWPATWGAHTVDYGMDPEIVNHPIYGGEALKAALTAIPTISLTTDLANFLDPTIGIYSNSLESGREWERPASVELIHPDGSSGFQTGAGVRIRGSHSASPENPKHSLRLFFRSEYGDSRLKYPLFGQEGVGSFEKFDLRAAQNYSWSFEGSSESNFVAEVFARDLMRSLGQPYTRSRFYHLYLNGQYWGLYQSEERPDAAFAASYLGGDKDKFDVVKDESATRTIEATDGNLDAWRRLWAAAIAPGGLASDDAYYRLQGKNPEGIDDLDYEVLLDVDNLIDYMAVIFFTGNLDGPIAGNAGSGYFINNFFAMRDRTGRQGFKFIIWDAEHSLLDPHVDRTGPFPIGAEFPQFNPQFLHQQLMANATYRERFAGRVQGYLAEGGAFSPEVTRSLFLARAVEIAQAIYAESARWGDAKRPDAPLTPAHWLEAVGRVLEGFLPARTAIVAAQLRAHGFPPPEAPVAPQPVAPQPVAPQPVAPQPVAPQPVAPQPVMVTVGRVAASRTGRRAINLNFDAPVDPASVANPRNYRLVAPGRDRRFGTRDDLSLPLAAATYDPWLRVVTLRTRFPVPLRVSLLLTSPGGALLDASSVAVDGDRDGLPGGEFAVLIPARRLPPPRPPRPRVNGGRKT